MKIELFDNKTDAKIYLNEEFLIEENSVYRAICLEGKFKKKTFTPVLLMLRTMWL